MMSVHEKSLSFRERRAEAGQAEDKGGIMVGKARIWGITFCKAEKDGKWRF
ncbi:hypothetical protein GVI59_17415 [Acetobacter sicerae]|nr:hypothetical protein [Acetobacter sicerae]